MNNKLSCKSKKNRGKKHDRKSKTIKLSCMLVNEEKVFLKPPKEPTQA